MAGMSGKKHQIARIYPVTGIKRCLATNDSLSTTDKLFYGNGLVMKKKQRKTNK